MRVQKVGIKLPVTISDSPKIVTKICHYRAPVVDRRHFENGNNIMILFCHSYYFTPIFYGSDLKLVMTTTFKKYYYRSAKNSNEVTCHY